MAAEPDQARCLTIGQVADELNVKQSLVQGLISTGELRAFQVGGRGLWRIGRQDIENLIKHAYRRNTGRIVAGELEDGTEPATGSC